MKAISGLITKIPKLVTRAAPALPISTQIPAGLSATSSARNFSSSTPLRSPKKPESFPTPATNQSLPKNTNNNSKPETSGAVEELSPEDLELVQDKLSESISRLSGTAFNSVILAVPMVILVRFMVGTRKGKSYAEIAEEFKDVKAGQILQDAVLLIKRRVTASLIPTEIIKALELTSTQSVLCMSFIETLISGLPKSTTSETYQRFRMIHGSTFDFIDTKENLLTIDKDGYNLYLETSKREADEKKEVFVLPKNSSWEDLEKLQHNFTSNVPAQTVALAARNLTFALGIFTAKGLATIVVAQHPEIFNAFGFDPINNPQAAIEACAILNRAIFAVATTPFDNALTKLSSGETTFAEFKKLDFSSKVSFRGGAARTAFVFLAFCTIAYGEEGWNFIKDVILDSPAIKIAAQSIAQHQRERTGKTSHQSAAIDNNQSIEADKEDLVDKIVEEIKRHPEQLPKSMKIEDLENILKVIISCENENNHSQKQQSNIEAPDKNIPQPEQQTLSADSSHTKQAGSGHEAESHSKPTVGNLAESSQTETQPETLQICQKFLEEFSKSCAQQISHSAGKEINLIQFISTACSSVNFTQIPSTSPQGSTEQQITKHNNLTAHK